MVGAARQAGYENAGDAGPRTLMEGVARVPRWVQLSLKSARMARSGESSECACGCCCFLLFSLDRTTILSCAAAVLWIRSRASTQLAISESEARKSPQSRPLN